MLREALSLLLGLLRRATESEFDVSAGSRETQEGIYVIVLYCCDTFEVRKMFPAQHDDGRQNFCVRCHSKLENRVTDRKSGSGMVAEAKKMPGKVEDFQEKTGNLARGACNRRWREVLA